MPTPICKTLTALGAGALLLVGTGVHAQDPYTDRTQDRDDTTESQTAVERARTGNTDDPMVVREEEPYPEVAEEPLDDPLVADDNESAVDEQDPLDPEIDLMVQQRSETAQRRSHGQHGHGRMLGFVPCPDDVAAAAAVTEVDDERLETLVRIHADMQAEAAGLDDQSELVRKKLEIIERHGWTRGEFNQVVQRINQDPELAARFETAAVAETTASVDHDR